MHTMLDPPMADPGCAPIWHGDLHHWDRPRQADHALLRREGMQDEQDPVRENYRRQQALQTRGRTAARRANHTQRHGQCSPQAPGVLHEDDWVSNEDDVETVASSAAPTAEPLLNSGHHCGHLHLNVGEAPCLSPHSALSGCELKLAWGLWGFECRVHSDLHRLQ